jgi:cytoskeleton protein RodZ
MPKPLSSPAAALPNPPQPAAAPKPIPAAPPSPAPSPFSSQQAGLPASPLAASAPASSAHRIVLVARADSWVELRDESGASIYSRVLRKDERYEVPERQGLVMMTGNAGGVEVLVDGRAAPALGTSGAVKRNIVMDPDKLLAGTAVPPPPPPQPATPTP